MASRSDQSPAIVARDVSKRFLLRHNPMTSFKDRVLSVLDPSKREHVEPFWALRDVSLEIGRGETVALVGRNGSGKSTFLKLVAGIFTPTTGALFLRRQARVGTMIELGIGFHPELTALENVYLNAGIHGMARGEVEALLPAIIEYSGLANFMDVPLRNFSSGMYMRLGFAIAANLEPDVLLIDEVFAVGDADFQRRCVATIHAARDRGATILFVSHSTAAVREVCSRVVVLDAGRVSFDGDVDEGLTHYARLMATDSAVLPGADARQATHAAQARPHRVAMHTTWEALGPWAEAFLTRQGLTRESFVLDLGCGSMPVATHVMPLVDLARYWGIDGDRELFDAGVRIELRAAGVLPDRGHFLVDGAYDLSSCPYAFDFALAHSLARRVSPDELASALTSAVGHLAPGGRLFVAVPAHAEAHLGALDLVATRAGLPLETVVEAAHPGGDVVYLLRRGGPPPAGR